MTKAFNRKEVESIRRDLRQNMPKAEVLLWQRLRSKQINGLRFRRQFSVGNYVLDFYCPSAKLGIELDGETHFTEDGIKHDEVRSRVISEHGIELVRFTNTDIYKNLEGVVTQIALMVEERI